MLAPRDHVLVRVTPRDTNPRITASNRGRPFQNPRERGMRPADELLVALLWGLALAATLILYATHL